MLTAIWPSFATLPNHLPASAGLTTAGMISYFLYWLITATHPDPQASVHVLDQDSADAAGRHWHGILFPISSPQAKSANLSFRRYGLH
jgi:hypothetical protein